MSTELSICFSLHLIIEDVDVPPNNISTLYDLIANVTHESVAGTTRDKENTIWKAHIRAAGGGGDNEKWFMIQDLIVEETRKEMIFLGETILQVRSFSFNHPKAFNVALTDLGTPDRSTMTMTMNTMEIFHRQSCLVPLLNVGRTELQIDQAWDIYLADMETLISLCFLAIGNGLTFWVVRSCNILARNNFSI